MKKDSRAKFELAKTLLANGIKGSLIAKAVGRSNSWVYTVKKFDTYEAMKKDYREKGRKSRERRMKHRNDEYAAPTWWGDELARLLEGILKRLDEIEAILDIKWEK